MTTKSRKNRRQDGRIRPSVLRYRRRKRRAWLDQFDPDARAIFFAFADLDRAMWIRKFQRDVGVDRAEASKMLFAIADGRRWRKLQTTADETVGIAPTRTGPWVELEILDPWRKRDGEPARIRAIGNKGHVDLQLSVVGGEPGTPAALIPDPSLRPREDAEKIDFVAGMDGPYYLGSVQILASGVILCWPGDE